MTPDQLSCPVLRLEADPDRAMRLKDCLEKWSGFSARARELFWGSYNVAAFAERPCTSSPTVATKRPPRPSCVGALSSCCFDDSGPIIVTASRLSEPQSQIRVWHHAALFLNLRCREFSSCLDFQHIWAFVQQGGAPDKRAILALKAGTRRPRFRSLKHQRAKLDSDH